MSLPLTAEQVELVVRRAQEGGVAGLVALLSGLIASREIAPIHVWEERSREAAAGSQFSVSLVKGILILAHIVGGELMSVNDVAADLQMSASTAHRYFHTLRILGLVEQDSVTRKYRLAA